MQDYEAYWSAEGFNPEGGLGPETARMISRILTPGQQIVDVGCGDGNGLGRWAAAKGHAYLGLDVSHAALAKARSLGLAVQHITDASQLPLPSISAGAVACLEVFEHLLDPASAVAEIKRVLEPGGFLIATVPNAAYWIRRVELGLFGRFNPYGDDRSLLEPWRDPHLRFFTRKSLASMAASAGLVDITVTGELHPAFSTRTRIENGFIYRGIMHVRPSLLAPTLLLSARAPVLGS